MKRQICNNCGRTLKMFDKGYLYEGKVVCGKCIKILAPDGPKQRPDYAGIAVKAVGRGIEAIDKATVQSAKDRDASEAVRYQRAKYRVIFFLNGCITVFWVIALLHVVALVVFSITIIGT